MGPACRRWQRCWAARCQPQHSQQCRRSELCHHRPQRHATDVQAAQQQAQQCRDKRRNVARVAAWHAHLRGRLRRQRQVLRRSHRLQRMQAENRVLAEARLPALCLDCYLVPAGACAGTTTVCCWSGGCSCRCWAGACWLARRPCRGQHGPSCVDGGLAVLASKLAYTAAARQLGGRVTAVVPPAAARRRRVWLRRLSVLWLHARLQLGRCCQGGAHSLGRIRRTRRCGTPALQHVTLLGLGSRLRLSHTENDSDLLVLQPRAAPYVSAGPRRGNQ